MATTENKRELHHINDGAIVSFDLKKNKIDKVIHHGLTTSYNIIFRSVPIFLQFNRLSS